ncbi:MAG: hypothetical protein U0531_07885 [Dehalococcoidia bacterium]
MAAFGVRSANEDYRLLRIPGGQRYRGRDYAVEPDASSMRRTSSLPRPSRRWSGAALPRLGRDSAQGDLGLLGVLERMGCAIARETGRRRVRGPARLRAVEADFTRMGDVATTLAAIAPFADGPVTIRRVAKRISRRATDPSRRRPNCAAWASGLRTSGTA